MSSKKLIVMIEVETENVVLFNDFWIDVVLPIWEGQGARHIGSFLRKDNSGIVRLLEFENEEAFAGFRHHMDSSEEGKAAGAQLSAYKFSAKTTLLHNS